MEKKTIQLATILFKGSRSIGLKREEAVAIVAAPKKPEHATSSMDLVAKPAACTFGARGPEAHARKKGCASSGKQKTMATIHSRDQLSKSLENKPEKAVKKKTQPFQTELALIAEHAGSTVEAVRAILDSLLVISASELRKNDKFNCGICVMKLKRAEARPIGTKEMFGKVVETKAKDAKMTIRFSPTPQLLAKVRADRDAD